MLDSLKEWYRNLRSEHPRRIKKFRLKIEELNWDQQNSNASLHALFYAVDALAEAEVRYYFRRRRSRAWISGIARFSAWTFGTIGVLLPLLSGTELPALKEVGHLGYACLALAASFLALNALFGGTEGHIRFVATQLDIEKIITSARIKWCNYLTKIEESNQKHDDGFALIQSYANALYARTISEAGRWGEATSKELENFQKEFKIKNKLSPGKEN